MRLHFDEDFAQFVCNSMPIGALEDLTEIYHDLYGGSKKLMGGNVTKKATLNPISGEDIREFKTFLDKLPNILEEEI